MKKLFPLLSMLVMSNQLLAATDPQHSPSSPVRKGVAAFIEPPMVTVPGGEYQMGGGKPAVGETIQDPNVLPIHKVKIAPFKLGKYEVTVAEFRRFVEATGYKAPDKCRHQATEGWFNQGPTTGSWDKNDLSTSDFQPVVCVSWSGADAYAKWLSQQTGKSYRLASEAEWEYAVSFGRGKPGFPFDEDIGQKNICKYANVADQSAEHAGLTRFGASYMGFMGGISACDDGAGFASIVGMYKPNPLGLYDMIGNVSEYLQDCWSENYEGAPTDGSARMDGDCKKHVLRGGAWHWRGHSATQRGAAPIEWTGAIEGFRIAQSLTTPADRRASPTARVFEKQLAQAQAVEQKRRKNVQPFPQAPQHLQLTEEKSGIQLSWERSSDPMVLAYHVYRNDSMGGVFKRIASDLTEPSYIDQTSPASKHSYVVVAVNRDRFSEFSALVSTADQVHPIPGRIQAEHFNQKDKAVVGKVAAQEDIEDAGGQAGSNLTGSGPGMVKDSWTEYSVDVQRSGNYRFTFRVASQDGSKGLALSVNNQTVLEQTVPATGGLKVWKTVIAPEQIRLEAGRHVLRIRAIDIGMKLNWFSIELVD